MTAGGGSPRVLITGATGFLGSYLIRSYRADGWAVRATARLHPPAPRTETDGEIEWVNVDVRDAAPLRDAAAGCDLVIHAAALTRARGAEAARALEEVNVQGTRNVLAACLHNEVPRLVHVSSAVAVGVSPDPRAPAGESFGFNLHHLNYPASKHRAERVLAGSRDSNVDAIIVNPSFVFGRHGDRYRGSYVIDRVLSRSTVTCTTGGLGIVHIDDVVDGIRLAAARGRAGERYLLSGENCTFRGIIDTVCRVAGVRRRVLRIPDLARNIVGFLRSFLSHGAELDPFDPRYAFAFYSSEKARSQLGFDARRFEAIVADYLDFRSATR